VADRTGGEYYRAENADQLGDALTDLPSAVTVVHEDKDLAAWFAGVGGLLCAAAVGLSLWWNRAMLPPRRAAG
jgi:Ca-activated chloride channel family protein